MKKILIGICASSLFLGQVCYVPAVWAESGNYNGGTASSSAARSKAKANSTPKTQKGANKDGLGKKYGGHEGNAAAATDMAIDTGVQVGSMVAGMILNETWMPDIIGSIIQLFKQETWAGIHAAVGDFNMTWFPLYVIVDIVGPLTSMAHAAVDWLLRKQTEVTASFTGTEGYVTDKWVGPPARNTVTKIMGDLGADGSIVATRFDTLQYDPSEYEGLAESDKKNPTPSALMKYREDTLIEDQRNLTNVAGQNWDLLYRSQQRAIKSMAGAMKLKEQLRVLSTADDIVKAEYSTQPQVLNTLAARRTLNDALMLLKMQVVAARVKIRGNSMELEFKPKQKETETLNNDNNGSTTPPPNITGQDAGGRATGQ